MADNAKCQDSSGYCETRLGANGPLAAVSAIADGLGSCAFSDEGSHIAVESVLAYFKSALTQLADTGDAAVLAALRDGFGAACDAIDDYARDRYPVTEMDTTLTVALYVEDGTTYIAHIGDGGIVAMFTDGEYRLVTTRHKGDFSNSVYPLYGPESESMWEFKRLDRPVAALALMTDGVLDNCVDREKLDSRVYFPFLARALTRPYDTADEAESERAYWDDMLKSDAWRGRITDDITFSTVQNPELVRLLPAIKFDEAAWKLKTQEVRAQEDAALKARSEQHQEAMTRQAPQRLSKHSKPAVEAASAVPSEGAAQADASRAEGTHAEASKAEAPQTEAASAKASRIEVNQPERARTVLDRTAGSPDAAGTQAGAQRRASERPRAHARRERQPDAALFGHIVHVITAAVLSVFVTICMQYLFPSDGAFIKMANVALAGVFSGLVAYFASRVVYLKHDAQSDGNSRFWRVEALVTVMALIVSLLTFILISGKWLLIILPAILIIVIVFMLMGL